MFAVNRKEFTFYSLYTLYYIEGDHMEHFRFYISQLNLCFPNTYKDTQGHQAKFWF